MQPQQPYYGPPQQPAPAPLSGPTPPGQNPYDFIVNPGKPPRRNLFGGGASKVQRMAVLAAGAAVVLIIIIVIVNLIFGGGGGNAVADIKVAQDQTEIARVARLGVQQQDIGQAAKNVAITAQLTLASDQQQLIDYLQKNGVKISDKELAALQDPQADQQLSTADANSTYDSTFLSIMQTDLSKYQQTLNTAYQGSKSIDLRQLLRGQYDNAGLLLEQIKSAQEQ